MPSPPALRHNDTSILVNVLVEHLQNGKYDLLPYDKLTKAIGYDVRAGSGDGIGYTRLLSARRIVEREHRVIFEPAGGEDHGKGLMALDDDGVLSKVQRLRERVGRTAKRGRKVLAVAEYDNLDPDSKVRHNTEAVLLGVVQDVSAEKSAKKIGSVIGQTQQLISTRAAIEALFK